MSLRLALASVPLPAFVRRRILRVLANRMARAFGTTPPDVAGLSLDAAVSSLARHTRKQAELVQASPAGAPVVRQRLRREGCALGARLRRALGARSRADAMRAARIVYRAVGIDFAGTPDGDIHFRRCAFSAEYAPATCELISSLDEGLIAGLAGEGRLRFTARITEGADGCAAAYTFAAAAR